MLASIFKLEDSGKVQATGTQTGGRDSDDADRNIFVEAKDTIQDRRAIDRLYCHFISRWWRSKRDRMLLEIGE